MKKTLKRIGIAVAVLLIAFFAYAAYVFGTYYRLPDKLTLEVMRNGSNSYFENEKKVERQNNNGIIKKAIIIALAVVCLGGGIFIFMNNMQNGDKEGKSMTDVEIKNVTDMPIVVMAGPDNMRQYKYTGGLVDSLGALPNGKGIAKFAKYGDIPASIYEGNFVDGICEDKTGTATMTFDSGDKFVGSFEGGFYSEGKYTLSDNSYFKGTFKKGVPFNGKWYNADGSFSANVVNGVETN